MTHQLHNNINNNKNTRIVLKLIFNLYSYISKQKVLHQLAKMIEYHNPIIPDLIAGCICKTGG